MPGAIAYVAENVGAWIGSVVLEAGASTAVADAAYYVAATAVYAAAYYGITTALTPSPSTPSLKSQSSQIMVQGTSESHRIIYGEIQCSGVFYPLGTTGTDNKYLHYLVVYAAHPCDSFGQLNIAGEAASLDLSGNVSSGKYSGLMTVNSHLGAWNQTVDTDIQANFGTAFWPDTAKLQGRAYDYIRIQYDKSIAAAGIPNITRVIKGRKVYDPRDATQDPNNPDTWKWSSNPALCCADWVMGVPYKNGAGNVVRNFGFRADWTEVSEADLVEAANICDESIETLSGPEARFSANGLIQTSATRGDVLDQMRSSMVGDIVNVGGQWIIHAGAYRTPNANGLSEDDFRAPISGLQVKPSRSTIVNGVKGTYVSPDNNWQASDAPVYTKQILATNLVSGDEVMIVIVGSTDWTAIGAPNNNVGTIFTATGPGTGTGLAESYIVEDGGDRIWLDVELPFTTSSAQAQRIFKIHLEKARQTIKFTGSFKLTALQNQATDVVPLSIARYGWASKLFRIESFSPVVESGASASPLIGCDVGLVETASAIYDWDPTEETAADLAPNTTLPNPFVVDQPTGLVVADVYKLQVDGSYVPQVQLSWNQSTDQFVLSGGKVLTQYKLHTDSTWTDWSILDGTQTSDFVLGLIALDTYDFRVAFQNVMGNHSSYTEVDSHTLPSTNAPLTPTGCTLNSPSSIAVAPAYQGGSLMFGTTVMWTNPPGSDFSHVEIKATYTDSDSAVDYTWFGYSSTVTSVPGSPGAAMSCPLYYPTITPGFVRIRGINRAGIASAWVSVGNANVNCALPAGSMSTQQQTSPKMTGVQIGGSSLSSSAKVINNDAPDTAVYTTTGGSGSEKFYLDISGLGFSSKPTQGSFTLNSAPSTPRVALGYDFDDAGNSSTQAAVWIYTTTDGATLPASTPYRFGYRFTA